MKISTINNLIDLFWSSKKQMLLFAFWKNSTNTTIYKNTFLYSKSGKRREIKIPTLSLKLIQRIILQDILYPHWESSTPNDIIDICTWFCRWKSIIDNAKPHINKKLIIKIDLKNFFPSISQTRVFGMFHKTLWYNIQISSILSWLSTYDNQLPQWAPTSPLIANIICKNLDIRIINYLKKISKSQWIKLNYTRYADDITVSLSENNIYIADFISSKIFLIIKEENFIVNYKKYKIVSNNHRQKVTWIIVNSKISLWRKKYRTLKSIVHNINKNWWEIELAKWNSINNLDLSLEDFQYHLKWKISYFSSINNIYKENLILY